MSEAPLHLGRRIAGKYVLEAHVGGGAMGEVYRARHVTLDTKLAIKIMREDIARNPEFRERFLREARATSRLEHPNSVRVVDFGEEPDGLTYLAMEFLDGRDLLTVLREDWPLPDARVVDLLAQALSAVSVAHGLGIIHRDLKPENIMVLASHDDDGPRDLVKVCDFGIAKLTDPRAFKTDADGRPLTSSGAVVGTPEYMSPEQARGDGLDARSDIYSVGIILYQMLTGRVPFTAENALGVVLKQVIDTPAPPSSVRPGVNPRLEAICLRAISKAPDARYATAREMRHELRAAAGGVPGVTPSRPQLDSDPALFGAMPTHASSSSGKTERLSPGAYLPHSSGALPATPPSAPSTPDFNAKPSTGGAEVAIAAARPQRPFALVLAAMAASVLGALLVVGVVLGLRARRAPAGQVAASAASSTVLQIGGGEGAEGPVVVPPLPPAASSESHTSLAPPSSRPVAPAAPASAPRAPAGSASVAPTATPPALEASSAPAAPASASAAPIADYNPRGAFVGVLDVQTSHVRAEAVTSLVRASNGKLTSCYQDALRMAGAPVGGRVEMTLTIDERGTITYALVNERRLPAFVRCVRDTFTGRSVGAVDGPATATQWLDLHP